VPRQPWIRCGSRTPSRPRLALLGVLSATAALLGAACSSNVIGPLGGPGDPGTECFPAALGRTVTEGFFPLENTGKAAATVQRVALTKPRGMAVTTKAWLVPIWHTSGHFELIGDGFPYPPVTYPGWKHREPAIGAVIKPGRSLNLVYGIKRTARTGTSGGPTITYTAGGNTYTLTYATSLVMKAGNC
jgi:hypothetical protein